VSYAEGVKMESVKIVKSDKGKDLLVIKVLKFHFQNILMAVWNDGVVLKNANTT
jgi:hypothetical protein